MGSPRFISRHGKEISRALDCYSRRARREYPFRSRRLFQGARAGVRCDALRRKHAATGGDRSGQHRAGSFSPRAGRRPQCRQCGLYTAALAARTFEGDLSNPVFGFNEAMSGIPDRQAKIDLVKALLARTQTRMRAWCVVYLDSRAAMPSPSARHRSSWQAVWPMSRSCSRCWMRGPTRRSRQKQDVRADGRGEVNRKLAESP